MGALNVVLRLFPRSFSEQYGPEWVSVSEALLAQAKTRGTIAWLGAWMRLMLDTVLRAPMAHGQDLRDRVVGTPPVLAGMTGGQAALALVRHWGQRPAVAGANGLYRRTTSLVAGLVLSVIVYALLREHAASIVTYPADIDIDIDGAGWAGGWGWILQHVMLWLYLFIGVIILAVGHKRMLRRWRATGGSMAWSLAFCSAGFLSGLYFCLTSELRAAEKDALGAFVAFPRLSEMPTQLPYLAVDDPKAQWTPEQKIWFEPDGTRVRPDKLQQWCAIRLSSLNTERILLESNLHVGSDIAVLLWNARLTMAYSQGCMDEATLMEQTTRLALYVGNANTLFQKTWEPVSLLPLIDQVLAAHYIIYPQMLRGTAEQYCTAFIERQKALGQVLPSHTVITGNDRAILCQGLNAKFIQEDLRWPEPPRWRALLWKFNLDASGLAKHYSGHTAPISLAQIQQIKQALLARPQDWQVPITPQSPIR